MAIGVDTSKWKPRKLKGTPAAKAANIIGAGFICLGLVSGLILQYGDITKKARDGFEKVYVDPIEEVERRLLIANSLPTKTGDQLRKILKEAERIDLPDK